MDGIEVDRLKLIDTMKANRELHVKEFNESIAGYRILVIAKMKENLEAAIAGRAIETNIHIENGEPRSFQKEYDDVIGLLEMGTRETVTLDTGDYRRYVKDEWNWSSNFKSAHRVYYAATQVGFTGE